MKTLYNTKKTLSAVRLLKAVAHPTRIKILLLLCKQMHNVGQLTKNTGLPQAIVSQQLTVLKKQNLIAYKKQDGFSVYFLNNSKLKKLLCCLCDCLGEESTT